MKEKGPKETTQKNNNNSIKTVLADKKTNKKKKQMTDKDKKLLNIAFNILAVFCIAIFCIALTPKLLQNDTFYTVKVGQGIREWGIDGQDHY